MHSCWRTRCAPISAASVGLSADHPAIVRIRELSRTEDHVGFDLRRTVNQLYPLLLRYYPQLLQICPTPDEPWIWALLEVAPTPERAGKLKVQRIRQLLAKHRIRRWSAEKVAEILSAPQLPLASGTADAVSEHALLLVPQLRLLSTMRKQVADRMEALLDEMATSSEDTPETQVFRDVAVLCSLPGIGRVVSGALLAEAAGPLRQRDLLCDPRSRRRCSRDAAERQNQASRNALSLQHATAQCSLPLGADQRTA